MGWHSCSQQLEEESRRRMSVHLHLHGDRFSSCFQTRSPAVSTMMILLLHLVPLSLLQSKKPVGWIEWLV